QNRTPAKGAMGIVLTPEHSLAVDTKYLPLGLPIFVTTQHPIKKVPFSRLAIAQDRGAAIKGKQRVDFFWGFGEQAAQCAGRTKGQGQLIVLLPKNSVQE
ncbi:MAG: 3D domain-containing protein, partial [Thiovulaceae bacterium]|nr:3D domain-containing protein [Sulfurimonadaceae bacterium]